MDSPTGGRAKRQKIDKQGRFSALEKLRELKGTKRKYDVGILENVYDTVDETEYTDRVLQRQEDDWIDDDDGMGYVEDGREIFDDEDIEDVKNGSTSTKNKDNRAKKRKSKVSALSNNTVNQGKGSIRSMISNMPNKKKEDVKISEDNILSDIMSEINSDNVGKPTEKNRAIKSTSNTSRPVDFLQQSKREAMDYFKSFNSVNVKPKSIPALNDFKIKKEAPKLVDEKENDDHRIVEVVSPKKEPVKVIKKEPLIELKDSESLTQKIEEFNSQDLHFDGIDFDNDSLQEPLIVKSENMEIDGLNVDDFIDIDTKVKAVPLKQETHLFSSPDQVPISMQNDFESLPLYTYKDGSKAFRFYWWDAWEDRFVKPGVVFLFGKVYIDQNNPLKGCASCCVAVRNIEKKLYLLPREYKLDPITFEADSDSPVVMEDVYNEFNTKFINKNDIKEFRWRSVSKNYAFDLPEVPIQSDYLEVRYAANYPVPPTEKYLTFSHIFGSNTSSLEILLLENMIKGPCWLEIKAPEHVSNKVSWCKIEVNALKPAFVTVLRDENAAPPPLVIATINTRTIIDPKTRLNMIVMLSCLVTNSYEIHKPPANPPFQQHFCIMTRSANEIWPTDLKQALSQFKGTKLTKCESERELLSYFLVQFWKLDPDIVLGHDLYGYQQDLIIGNIVNKNIPNWSRLGRLRRTVAPQKKFLAKDAFLGRLVCDIKLSSMELIRSRSYDLITLCTNVLKMPEGSIVEIIPDDLYKYYDSSRDLLELVSLTMQDTTYILRLMYELNVLPLALQITQIAGNVMSRTLMGGRSERNEFLLLHAFTEKDYIVPDKVFGKKENVDDSKINEVEGGEGVSKKQVQSRKKPAYSGGLVLDPKKGFYENLVLLMDFNSLYPSIIQEYNICFTTIKRNAMHSSDEEVSEMILPESTVDAGVLPTQIRRLVESRREVKKLMKVPDLYPEQYMQYNIRQLALKLTANSMYGCLGFTYSRFYAKPLAALVTLKGREILINTKELVSKLNYDVIYGDTDSIMINTNCLDYDQVFKIGHEIKKEINKKYKQIELDIDGVFKYLLLLKKKKYAAVLLSKNKNGEFVTTQELKGLDIVRRDWSQLAAEAGKFILNQILSEQSPDERVESIQAHLMKLKDDLKDGKMPLSLLTITKQLTKNPTEYADKNSQPHVQVSLRLNSKNGRKYKKGDIVPYIICEDGTKNANTQRAYHIEELKSSESLTVDINYYLAHQLHPVISRICEPIDGLNSARIADFLGLDPSAYKQFKRDMTDNAELFVLENEKDKYRQCNDFIFTCMNGSCKTENYIREVFRTVNRDTFTFLERCQNEQCGVRPMDYLPTILNQLTVQMRSYNSKYYENWLICEDPACTNRTVRLPHYFTGGYPWCNLCEKGVMFREYTEKDLYYQISYFHYLFDIIKQNVHKLKLNPQVMAAFHSLKECVEDVLSHSAYSVINLEHLFSFFDMKAKNINSIKMEPYNLDIAPDIDLDDFGSNVEIEY